MALRTPSSCLRVLRIPQHGHTSILNHQFHSTMRKPVPGPRGWFPIYPEQHRAQEVMPGQTSFEFRSTAVMLHTLTKLPRAHLEKIRNIRVKGVPFGLCSLGKPDVYFQHGFPEALNLLPGLQLDRLTVLDCYHQNHYNGWEDVGTYLNIDHLLNTNGWKEFHFSTPTTEFMTGAFDKYKRRVAQPMAWDEAIRERDGDATGAEVRMYTANAAETEGLTANSATRSSWECEPGHLSKEKTVSWAEDSDEPPDFREVLVVAKRGVGVDYAQDGSQLHGGIKNLIRDLGSWEKIKESEFYYGINEDWP